MRCTFVLLPLAALAAGCHSSTPCDAPFLNVYWVPGPAPNGGFQVPGLVEAGFPERLGCVAAGVAGVKVRVGGAIASCSAGLCLDPETWFCNTGGLTVPLSSGGTYEVQVDAVDAAGNLEYTSDVHVAAASECGGSVVGVASQGVAGPLGVDYAFTDGATCQQGTDIVWDLRGGISTPFDTGSIGCGSTNPFLVSGGHDVPAGVYTLERITEAAGASVFHALCGTTFVHAGSQTLAVDLPPPTASCP